MRFSLSELGKQGKLVSGKELLQDFGFQYCYIEEEPSRFLDSVKNCGKKILSSSTLKEEDIKLLLLYKGANREYPASIKKNNDENSDLSIFKYDVSNIHSELKLSKANAITFSEQGCSGLLAMINIGYHYLNSSSADAILCLAGDFIPKNQKREIMYNIMSDASCGLLLQKNSLKNKILGYHQIAQSYYWDTPKREQELLASYFPMAQRVITEALEKCGMSVKDVDWVVPHNVSKRSWQILGKMLGIPEEKIWMKNISEKGHTISCDHIINLCDMEQADVIKKGDILVLFTFGFGATWSCLIIEH